MRPKLLLTISAIYLAFAGLAHLLAPEPPLQDPGNGASALLKSGSTASTFIGIAVTNWAARNAGDSKARRAIFLGNIVGLGLHAIMTVAAILAGGPMLGWVFVAIDLLLAAGFFVVYRADMSTGAS